MVNSGDRLAGQIAWAASIGPDVVKSRIQSSTGPNPGILVTSREIYRMYGARGFLVGVEVALFRAFPANAALFVGYELSRKLVA